MRRSIGLWGAVAAGILATDVAAQEPPDYSGAWTMAPAPATRANDGGRRGSFGSGWGSEFSIAQAGDKLTVERAFFSRSDLQPPMKFRYSLDGSETKNTVLMGRGFQEQVSTVAWEGNNLVITTVHIFENPEDGQMMTSEVKHTLSLEPAAREAWPPSLVVETTRDGVLGGVSSSTRTVYTKN